MSNANKTNYSYTDNHLYFWFGDHHSSEYKLFIVAKNDLKIENSTAASTQYSNAMFQEGSYLLGTSRKQKTFKRKVAAEGLTLDEYKEMMLWLYEGATGTLYFDSNPYWGWNVVLETVSDANVYYSGNQLIVELDLTWKTVGSYLATNRYLSGGLDVEPISTSLYTITTGNPYGLPGYFKSSTSSYEEGRSGFNQYIYIVSLGNQYQYINCTFNLLPNEAHTYAPRIKIAEVKQHTHFTNYIDVELSALDTSVVLQYNGNSNFVFGDGALIEQHAKFQRNDQTNGLLTLDNKPPILVELSAINEKQTMYQNLGYTHLIEVQSLDFDTAPWGGEWDSDAGGDATLATSQIRVRKLPIQANTTLNPRNAYYFVHTSRIALTTYPSSLVVHTYNNL